MIAVNFNILNQKGAPAVYEDTAANRPAAGQSGRLFIATDTKLLQRDNGTSYDTIGDNSLLGANNGLTLNGNDVELGGTLTKNTTITASLFGLGLGVAGNDTHKFYVVNSDSGLGQIKNGTAAILAQRYFATSTIEFDNKNLYGIAGTFIANLSGGKINSGPSYNNAAVFGSLNITANNGESTGYIRSVQAAAVFTDVNLQNVRLIEAKQVSFSGSNTVTNLTGLYIESLKTGEVTNAYGIYQKGTSDLNYFFGETTIENKLNVKTNVDGLISYFRFVNGTNNLGLWLRSDDAANVFSMEFLGSYLPSCVTFKIGTSLDVIKLYSNQKTEFFNDLEFNTTGVGTVLRSPNNTKYRISVDNAGALSTVAV